MRLPYKDRFEAGKILGDALGHYAGRADVVVVALPPGGVPVAIRVAERLGAALDLMPVRKLHPPGREDLTVGALAGRDGVVLNIERLEGLNIAGEAVEALVKEECRKLEDWGRACRGGAPAVELKERCVVLVDDGLTTGVTLEAALMEVRQQGPARVVIAVPVAPSGMVELLREQVDEILCLAILNPFLNVDEWYEDEAPASAAQIRGMLAEVRAPLEIR